MKLVRTGGAATISAQGMRGFTTVKPARQAADRMRVSTAAPAEGHA